MFYKRIELRPKIQGIQIDGQMQKLFWHFLYALDCNGQILKYYKVIQEENVVLYATAPAPASFSISSRLSAPAPPYRATST